MTNLNSILAQWSPRVLSIMRIALALLYMQHGSQKLFGIPPSQHPGPLALLSLIGVAGMLEFFGGLFLLMGLCTRCVAFILSGEMAVAYFIAHAPRGPLPLLNGGELAVVYCFVFLYLAFAGGGSWSVDQWLSQAKARRAASQ